MKNESGICPFYPNLKLNDKIIVIDLKPGNLNSWHNREGIVTTIREDYLEVKDLTGIPGGFTKTTSEWFGVYKTLPDATAPKSVDLNSSLLKVGDKVIIPTSSNYYCASDTTPATVLGFKEKGQVSLEYSKNFQIELPAQVLIPYNENTPKLKLTSKRTKDKIESLPLGWWKSSTHINKLKAVSKLQPTNLGWALIAVTLLSIFGTLIHCIV